MKMEEIEIESELSERYEGDAERLAEMVLIVKKQVMLDGYRDGAYELIDAVLNMLQNGCFCPSCMLAQLEPTYETPIDE
tara:strand:+ start:2277 stop:2513 length:237 start_codon:yes stop_codon:yes gene_type:complete